MRGMGPILTVLAIMFLPGIAPAAQEKPAVLGVRARPSLEALRTEYFAVFRSWAKEYEAALGAARKNGTDRGFLFAKPSPKIIYAPRFLALAENDPTGPEAVAAIETAIETTFESVDAANEIYAKGIKILQDCWVTKPGIRPVLGMLNFMDRDDAHNLVDLVIARNPDAKVQAVACRGKVAYLESVASFAEIVKDPRRLTEMEVALGKPAVADNLAKAEKARVELATWKRVYREKYADMFPNVSVGNAAPETRSHSIDGTEAMLSALKGKVVVLDIWTTWCGPCRAMIPHQRTLVEKFKDKPFALVSISADSRKQTLIDFLAKERMPWAHWWNGSEGGVIEDWDIRYFPTIYILDAKGVIRYKDLRGEELERAVNVLLDETTTD